jgi:glycosyltransferase involved in cell wall biosynthesis
MRILLVSHRYPPLHAAGAEAYAARLACALARRGHAVHVFAAEKDVARRDLSLSEREHEGVAVTELVNNLFHERFRATWDRPEVDALFEGLLERWRPDVVHLQHLMYLSIGCAEAAARRGIPVVFTLHDFWLQCPRFGQRLHPDGTLCAPIDFERCGGCLTSFKHAQSPLQRSAGKALAALRGATGLDLSGAARGAERLLRSPASAPLAEPEPQAAAALAREAAERDQAMRERLVPSVDLFLSPSRFLLERLVEWGIPADRIRHVRAGIDGARFASVARTTSDRLRVAFLGTLSRHKGPHVLVDAWSRLSAEQRERATLDLYGPPGGDPHYVAELETAARACGARLHPRLEGDAVLELHARTDLLVVPSLWYENQPLVILEALWARTPLAVSDLGGMAELVTEGETGLRFPAGDAGELARRLGELIADRRALEALQRARPAPPDVSSDVDQVERAYRELLAHRAPRPESGGPP